MYMEVWKGFKISVKQLQWFDGAHGSEAYGAGKWYIAEAKGRTLDEAKEKAQLEFESNILGSIYVENLND